MKLIVGFLIIGVLTVLLSQYAPWWICGVIAFGVSLLLRLKPGAAFLAGFLGVTCAWGISVEIIDVHNGEVLSSRVGELFMGMSSLAILIVTAVLGGLVGGFGGMTGGHLNTILFKSQTREKPIAR